MLDAFLRPLINTPLERAAKALNAVSLKPDHITWIGFGFGVLAMAALANGFYLSALLFIGLNRLCDGLDGALARVSHHVTDYGGYLDIVLDFIIYSGLVFAFALGRPEDALIAAFLIFSFIGTGGSFLAYAIIAAKRGVETEARGKKSFFHMGGLAEGTETIIALALICIFPQWFTEIALTFGALCWITTIGRIYEAKRVFRD